jgi:hypothetical protein
LKKYLPEFLGVALALLSLNLWYLSSVAIENEILPISYDYIFKGLTVLIGAFIGALSAFKLNENRENKKEYKEKNTALNKALFTLIRKINAVKSMRNTFSPYKTDLDRAFSLPAAKPPSYNDLKFNFEELDFLLAEYPQLLMNLSIEQERFEQTFSAIEVRNNFYVNEVQPALNDLNLNNRKIVVADFADALGERLFQGSLNGAQTMYSLIESTDKSLVEVHDEFSKIAREIFPGEKFVKWQAEA